MRRGSVEWGGWWRRVERVWLRWWRRRRGGVGGGVRGMVVVVVGVGGAEGEGREMKYIDRHAPRLSG